MPGGLITKIGVAAISLLLAAMLLTYTFTGGGGPEAEIDVPEAAGFDLQQRGRRGNRGRGAAASRAVLGYRPTRPSANSPNYRTNRNRLRPYWERAS